MYALCAILLMFFVVVGLHEAGHAVVARWCGVKIQRIAIGFGKPIYCVRDKRGIEWVLGIWLLGGYVQLLNTRIEQSIKDDQYQYCFDKRTTMTRCLILLAGGLFNFLVAWLAIALALSVGYTQYSPIIQTVVPQSLVANAGLKNGDRIVAINDKVTPSWQQAGMIIITVLGQSDVKIKVMTADHQTRSFVVDLRPQSFMHQKGSVLNRIGIVPAVDSSHLELVPPQPFFTALEHALSQCGTVLVYYLLVLKKIITGILPFSLLLGPLGLFIASIDTFSQGFSAFMLFLGMLSLAVGLVNFMPLPGLDGGSILYVLLEKIRGKPLSIAMEILLYRLATIVFFVLLMQLVLNDLAHYIHTPRI